MKPYPSSARGRGLPVGIRRTSISTHHNLPADSLHAHPALIKARPAHWRWVSSSACLPLRGRSRRLLVARLPRSTRSVSPNPAPSRDDCAEAARSHTAVQNSANARAPITAPMIMPREPRSDPKPWPQRAVSSPTRRALPPTCWPMSHHSLHDTEAAVSLIRSMGQSSPTLLVDPMPNRAGLAPADRAI